MKMGFWSGLGKPVGVEAKGGGEIRRPSGFTAMTPPFTIKKNGSSFRPASGWDVSSLKPITGADYFVDPVLGSNGNDGLSWGTAKKDIQPASISAGVGTIYIKTGFYHRYLGSGGWQGFGNAHSIVCVDPTPATLCTSRIQSYSVSGSHYNSTSTVQIFEVYDLSIINADGSYAEYTLAASESAADSTPGSFFWTANVLSVRTADDRAPDASIIAIVSADNISVIATSSKTIYMENCKVLFSPTNLVKLGGDGALLKAYFKDCIFSHGGVGHNYYTLGQVESILQNCVSEYAVSDCFNYHISPYATIGTAIEINCTGRYAGYTSAAGTTFNGSSTHDAVPIVRVGGVYHHSKGANIGDVGGSQSWNLGVESHHSLTPTAARNSGFLVGNTGPTKMWLDTCHSHDNTYDLAPIEGEAIYTRNCTLSAGQNYNDGVGGTVTAY